MPSLPRAAQAAPAAAAADMWAWITIALMILVALATTSSQHAEQARTQTIAAFKADLYDNGALATPEAFIARCGQPQTVLHPASGQYKGDTVLSYQGGAFHVHFHPGEHLALRSVHLEEDRPGHYREWEALTDESIVFDHLQCGTAK